MAKYKLQEMPDVHHDGKRRVYPKMIINRTLSRKEFVEMMHSYHRGTSPSMVEAVLIDVEDMLVRMLSMGYNVNLGNMGHYSLSLEFKDDKPTEMRDEDDKMTYRKVGVKSVNYKAAPEFVKEVMLETDRNLERDMGGVNRVLKSNYTREERIARALQVIEKNGFISLDDYAQLNNMSRTVASSDLKQITDDPQSLICSHGLHSHKVWVKREDANGSY